MPRLRGRVIRWSAPDNKGDAGRYWGHSGDYTLAVLDATSLAIRNAVEGVILRETAEVSAGELATYLGAEVEVEGEFDPGRIIETLDSDPGEIASHRNEPEQSLRGPLSAGVPLQAPIMQTLMVPRGLGEDGGVRYRPAPRYEGAGFWVRAIRRC